MRLVQGTFLNQHIFCWYESCLRPTSVFEIRKVRLETYYPHLWSGFLISQRPHGLFTALGLGLCFQWNSHTWDCSTICTPAAKPEHLSTHVMRQKTPQKQVSTGWRAASARRCWQLTPVRHVSGRGAAGGRSTKTREAPALELPRGQWTCGHNRQAGRYSGRCKGRQNLNH